jgi:hypothetical protein
MKRDVAPQQAKVEVADIGGQCAYCSFSISPLCVCPIDCPCWCDHHGEGSMTLMSRRPVEGIA